ncbi:MAG: MFS transporter [Methylobacteriaceae bacterium]|nr:MFS transporter [Methylobacteriaceae bacterium]
MTSRWHVLGLLFLVRTTMAFQFESVAAIGPVLEREFNVGLADIGMLIGLYLLPGVVIALPGGAIGRALGDKRTVLAGCAVMFIGNIIMAFSSAWPAQIGGRLLMGTGGVVLNVVSSKMVADWFAEREMATAMALFLNSWPFGIALALLALPPLAVAAGYKVVFFLAAGLVAAAGLLLASVYKDRLVEPDAVAKSRIETATILLVLLAGLIWGFFNTAIAMIFSFGMVVLIDKGWTITASGFVISLVLWLTIITVPLGGFVADRMRSRGLLIAASTLLGAALMFAASRTSYPLAVLIAFGLVCGLPAGAMMALPTSVLKPQTRASGMGIFFTLFYLAMSLGPVIAGRLAGYTGRAATALDFGAVLLIACPIALALFAALREGTLSNEILL